MTSLGTGWRGRGSVCGWRIAKVRLGNRWWRGFYSTGRSVFCWVQPVVSVSPTCRPTQRPGLIHPRRQAFTAARLNRETRAGERISAICYQICNPSGQRCQSSCLCSFGLRCVFVCTGRDSVCVYVACLRVVTGPQNADRRKQVGDVYLHWKSPGNVLRKNGLLAFKPDGGRHMRWGEEEQ